VLVEWQKHVYNIYSRADAEFPREIADLWVKFEKKIGDVIQYTTEQVIGAYQERIRQITERIGDTCMDCEKTNQLILVHEDTLELLRCTEYRRQKAEAEIEEDSLDCILLCLDCWFARLKHKRINGEEAALIR
jgi:Zn ribbon nucleic-acid-binding protein